MNFGLIGAAGFTAPNTYAGNSGYRSSTGRAVDPRDCVGRLDSDLHDSQVRLALFESTFICRAA